MHGYATLDCETGILVPHTSLWNIIDWNHTVPVAITASVCGVVAAHSIHVSAPSLCENRKHALTSNVHGDCVKMNHI